VVPFESWHLKWVELNPIAASSIIQSPYTFEEQAQALAQISEGYTGLREGKVVACAGVNLLWTGVFDLWMYLGIETFSEKRKALRIFSEFLDELAIRRKMHRLQAVVQSNYKEGRRMAKFFGFKEEGEMPNFGPEKETFIRVAKCF